MSTENLIQANSEPSADNGAKPNVRRSLPLSNQKLWEMAQTITNYQKDANDLPTDKVYWHLIEEGWYEWLESCLFGNDA